MSESISLDKCVHGKLYRIHSRNLGFGVFNSEAQGFIGIREKFGNRYLFTEYHWDAGAPFGTVHPKEELEQLPEDIRVKEDLGTEDQEGRPCAFDKPRDQGGKGWYVIETGKPCEGFPVCVSNKKLFDWLEQKSNEYYEKHGTEE